MNKRFLKFGTIVMALAISFSPVFPAQAASKKEAQDKLSQLQQEQSDLQSRLDQLKEDRANTEAYIGELDAEQQTVVEELSEIEERLTEIEGEIEVTEENLAQAQADADEQYAALKIRIRQMYEQGDTSLMEIVMNSSDISTILNSSEYIAKISQYDEELLTKLNDAVARIEKYEAQLQEQKADEETKKAEQEAKKADLDAILADKRAELETIGVDIDDVTGEIHDMAGAIDDTQQLIAAIEAAEKKAAEEAKKKQEQEQSQNQNQGGSNGGSFTPGNGSATGSLMWPTTSTWVTSGFGGRTSPGGVGSTNHKGIDIGAGAGAPIYAADGGVVAAAGWQVARGNYIIVTHSNGLSTLYQHCSAVYASAGQTVSKGQTIAAVGSTGYSTGPHLHFEVLVNGTSVDPMGYF